MDDTQSPDDAESGVVEAGRRTLLRRILFFSLVTLFLAALAALVGFGFGKYRDQTAVTSKRLQVTVLNVGHGEASWIRTPSGKTILIGSGPPEAGDTVVRSLRNAGVTRIDLLVLPYPYAECIGGVAAVLSEFPIAQVIEPGGPRVNQIHEDVRSFLAAKNVPIKIGRAGDMVSLDGASLQILAPSEPFLQVTPESANNSLVMHVRWGQTSFLFGGGTERAGEDALIARNPDGLRADWLRVSRFGTREATSPEFLHLVSPDFAVISAGAKNSGGYPHKETLEHLAASGAQVFRTDLTTAPELTFFSDGTTVSALRETK